LYRAFKKKSDSFVVTISNTIDISMMNVALKVRQQLPQGQSEFPTRTDCEDEIRFTTADNFV
jgi:hypothetical protein